MSGERDQAGHKVLVERLKGCSKETDVGCYIRWVGESEQLGRSAGDNSMEFVRVASGEWSPG